MDNPVPFHGARFVIGQDLGLYPFVRAGGFEERELHWLRTSPRKDDVVWDAGGNVGIYSVLMSKRVTCRPMLTLEVNRTTMPE